MCDDRLGRNAKWVNLFHVSFENRIICSRFSQSKYAYAIKHEYTELFHDIYLIINQQLNYAAHIISAAAAATTAAAAAAATVATAAEEEDMCKELGVVSMNQNYLKPSSMACQTKWVKQYALKCPL